MSRHQPVKFAKIDIIFAILIEKLFFENIRAPRHMSLLYVPCFNSQTGQGHVYWYSEVV